MQPRRGQDLVISLSEPSCEAILTTSCVSEPENLVLWKVGFLKLQWSQDSLQICLITEQGLPAMGESCQFLPLPSSWFTTEDLFFLR